MNSLVGAVQVRSNLPYFVQAALVGFGVNRAELKPLHRFWMDQYAKPMRRPGMFATVTGFTSPSGGEELNMGLSERRAEAVACYLQALAPTVPMETHKQWSGEQWARSAGLPDGSEDGNWRGVLVTLVSPSRIPFPPPVITTVERRTSVTLLVDESVGLQGFSSEPGERAFRAGMEAARYAFDLGTSDIVTARIDRTWKLTLITLTGQTVESKGGFKVKQKFVTVRYHWTPAAAGPQFPKLVDLRNKQTRGLSLVDRLLWLEHPMKAYMGLKYRRPWS